MESKMFKIHMFIFSFRVGEVVQGFVETSLEEKFNFLKILFIHIFHAIL